jgi:hypothetical protein
VAADGLVAIAADVVQAPNDKPQVEPMLGKIAELPDELGDVGELLADSGYFSEDNVNACAAAGIEPVIAMGREAHHPSLAERFAEHPAPPKEPTPLEAMRHRLQTQAGKKRYTLRKQIPEPVFGIIKSVLGFRQFMMRGRCSDLRLPGHASGQLGGRTGAADRDQRQLRPLPSLFPVVPIHAGRHGGAIAAWNSRYDACRAA